MKLIDDENLENLENLESRGGAVERAADAIRGLVISRELFPGQQLGQEELALRIGVSRGPTREALQSLSKEGLVTHSRNRGYTVTRFNFSEMEQLYTLRDLVETEVLRNVPAPNEIQLSNLRAINDRIRNPATSLEEAMRLNHDFHFAIFALSPYGLIVKEIERLWKMSMAYRALGMGVWSVRAAMMGDAHEDQIQALVDQDHERLVELSRQHRWVSLKRLEGLLR